MAHKHEISDTSRVAANIMAVERTMSWELTRVIRSMI
jgi:hypothetical protein